MAHRGTNILMIITKQKSGQDISKMLENKNKIFIVGCGDCAATCKTGGEGEVAAMAVFLKKQGITVTGFVTPDVTCAAAQVKAAFAKNKEALKKSDAILVLACGSGAQSVRENDRLGLDVLPGCESLFAALIDKDNNFQEVCSSCGECVLDLTEGICPVTRCSKGLLNGPCGGHNKGKCEVDKNRDCAWVLIYKKMKENGTLSRLKKRLPPKNYKVSTKPLSVAREAKELT